MPHIGCAVQKFSLAVEAWMDVNNDLFGAPQKVEVLMNELCLLKNAVRLRDITRFGATVLLETRWAGEFVIVRRYLRIEHVLYGINEIE